MKTYHQDKSIMKNIEIRSLYSIVVYLYYLKKKKRRHQAKNKNEQNYVEKIINI